MCFNLGKILSLFFKKQENDIICNTNKTKKLFFTGHEELIISVSSEKKAKEVSDVAYNILQRYKNKPQLILRYIEAKGTKIVFAPKILVLLKMLGYDEGFIPAHSGLKAGILNFIANRARNEKQNFALSAPNLFITCKKDLSLYFLAYQFHHWLSYQYKLPGYDMESMNIFRTTFNNQKANLKGLSINQILALKDTIDRDKQAIDFVQKFVREQVGAKERLNSILQGKVVKI